METDQGKSQPEEKKETFADYMGEGWEEHGAEIEGIKPAEKKADEGCVGCGKSKDELPTEIDQVDWDKVDYENSDWPKPIKVDGKIEWAANGKEMADHASGGVRFTQKTQAHSTDVKAFEQEKAKAIGDIERLTSDLNQNMADFKKLTDVVYSDDKVKAAMDAQAKAEGTRELTEEEIYQEYGIDPEYGDAATKQLALENYQLKKDRKADQSDVDKIKQSQLRKETEDIARQFLMVQAKAREMHPYEDFIDSNKIDPRTGKNLNITQKHFESLLETKMRTEAAKPEGEQRHPGELIVESVQEIHMSQKGSRGELKQEGSKIVNLDEITPERLKELRPDLYDGIHTDGKDQGVAEGLSGTEGNQSRKKVPPSLSTQNQRVDLTKNPKHKGNRWGESDNPVADSIADGFKEIDFDAGEEGE